MKTEEKNIQTQTQKAPGVNERIEAIQKSTQEKIAALMKEADEAKLKLMESELDKVRFALTEAVKDFAFEKDKVIIISRDDDGLLDLRYVSIVTRGATVKAKSNGNGSSRAVKLLIPKDVQEAWGTDAEYESKQAFYRVIAPGVDGAEGAADEAHAQRDAFNRMKADGATEGGMTLTKAWAKIIAHNS